MSKKKYKQGPCPAEDCKSSDAYTEYEDGGGYCFSCGYTKRKDKQEFSLEPAGEKTFGYTPHRGISEETLRTYGAAVLSIDGVPFKVNFPYPKGASKTKILQGDVPKKEKYKAAGEINKAGLFGSDLFDRGSRSSITINEGEHDALAIHEVLGDNTVSTSVQSSSTALRDVTLSFDYVNSFDKIILAFDSDPVGKKARFEVASLFDPAKVYHVNYDKYKDANKYLQNGERLSLVKVWNAHKKELPEGVIHSFADVEKTLKGKKDSILCDYPFDFLNSSLFGMHTSEMILLKGLEGIGKTEIFRKIEHHILRNTKYNLGIMHLEETLPETIQGLATYELEAPCMMPDSGITDSQVLEAYKKAVGGKEDRVYLQSSFDTDDPDLILSNIRFLVSGCGCKFIFLDHLNQLVTGIGEEDERKKLDYIATRLKKLTLSSGCCIFGIMHVNDNGQTRSSRLPPKIANTVINLERNITHIDPAEKLKTHFTVEKGRPQGSSTGYIGAAVYDNKVTYTLQEFKDPDIPYETRSAVL